MDVKFELNKIRIINSLIESDQRMIKELEHLKFNISKPVFSGLPKTKYASQSENLENIILKINKLQSNINKNIVELIDIKDFWVKEIDKLSYIEQLLIKLRYFESKNWCEVAQCMNYDVRQIHRLHGKVLKKMSLNVTKCH